MPLEVVTLRVLEGPNIYQPQPGIYLLLRSERDRSRRLRDAIKDAAQAVGLVLGFLDCTAQPQAGDDAGFWLICSFATPQPQIGAAIARYVVEGINRRLARDEEWDADGPLFEIGKLRRRESSRVELLQLAAEAQRRGLPVLRMANGQLRIGYGAAGWAFDPTQLAPDKPVAPPWERIGSVPVIAITGLGGARVAAEVAKRLATTRHVASRLDASLEEARAALSDPGAEAVVLGLRTDDIVARGVAFERCAVSAIVGALTRPEGADWSQEEQLRALSLPLLLTNPGGQAVIASDPTALAGVLGYATCPIVAVDSEAAAVAAMIEAMADG